MRIYGSSPLYTYVELIFRCKRMFIISIILGTVIASAMVATRATTYNASILVSLTGDNPELAGMLNGPKQPGQTQAEKENSPARRKASRLLIWIKETPDFLEDVVKNAQLDKKYPNKSVSDLVRDVRKNLAEPSMLTEQYMSLKLTWNKPDEAEDILNKLYARFSERTVNFETATVTSLRQIVQDQFKSAELKADVLARKRIAFQRDNFNGIPTMLATQTQRLEQTKSQLDDTRLDLRDAQDRLASVNQQLNSMPDVIKDSVEDTTQTANPVVQLKQDLDALNSKLTTLLAAYSPQHPAVVDQKKKIAQKQQEISDKEQELKSHPAPASTKSSVVKTSANPEKRELNTQKHELERTVSAFSRKVSELASTVNTLQANLRKMPDINNAWEKIDTDFQLQDQIRRNRKAQLAQLTLDEEREQKVKQNEVNLVVPPKAEKADSNGKLIVLYALGPLLGIVIAFCFSLLAETLDHTVRTPVEVEKYLNKPVLAVIPRMQTARDSRNKQLGGTSKTSISS